MSCNTPDARCAVPKREASVRTLNLSGTYRPPRKRFWATVADYGPSDHEKRGNKSLCCGYSSAVMQYLVVVGGASFHISATFQRKQSD